MSYSCNPFLGTSDLQCDCTALCLEVISGAWHDNENSLSVPSTVRGTEVLLAGRCVSQFV